MTSDFYFGWAQDLNFVGANLWRIFQRHGSYLTDV